MPMPIKLLSLNVGHPQGLTYQGKQVSSGISKHPVTHPLHLSSLNLEGDGQADLKHHGGPDKAVCAYPGEHYPFLENLLGKRAEPGAFGENLTLQGLLETDACIGDTYQWGEAVLQISQPRQPCFKLAAKHGLPELPKQVEDTGYTGFYFRVLREGRVSVQDELLRLEQDAQRVTVAYANRIMHHDKKNAEAMEQLLQLKALSQSWRDTFRRRLDAIN